MAVTRRELERILLAHPARHKPWYPFTPEEDRELSLAEKMQNPWWFIPLLRIISTDGQIFDLVDMYEEQAQFLRALLRWKQVIVIKPRQVGLSTMSTAFLFWYLYTATDQLGAVNFLLAQGADPLARTPADHPIESFRSLTPLGLARKHRRKDVIPVLEAAENAAAVRRLPWAWRGSSTPCTP